MRPRTSGAGAATLPQPVVKVVWECCSQTRNFCSPAFPGLKERFFYRRNAHSQAWNIALSSGNTIVVLIEIILLGAELWTEMFLIYCYCPQLSVACLRQTSACPKRNNSDIEVIIQANTSTTGSIQYRRINHVGWRFGVAVTRWSRSTQLLYIEPG